MYEGPAVAFMPQGPEGPWSGPGEGGAAWPLILPKWPLSVANASSRRSYLVVSDGVYDRIDAAVEEDHDDGEVVEVAGEIDVRVAEVVHEVVRLVPRPAEHEEQWHGRQRLDHVRAGTYHVVVAHLKPWTVTTTDVVVVVVVVN